MTSHSSDSEDGECRDSPRREEVIEFSDGGSFVLDRNDDAIDCEVITNAVSISEEAEKSLSTPTKTTSSTWKSSLTAGLLTFEEPAEAPPPKSDKRKQPMCFNCDGAHNIAKCTEPRNMQKIRENRNAFMDRVNKNKDTRYIGSESTANPFKAGRLSDDLQRALGIGPNDIPEYIYRMRKMGFIDGYPPGYLKKAIHIPKTVPDLLTFHSNAPDLQSKEGEESEEPKRPVSPTLVPDQIVYYFGFNKTYRALRDRERFNIPPFDHFVENLEVDVKKKWRKNEENKEKEVRAEKRRLSTQSVDENGSSAKKSKSDDDVVCLERPPSPPNLDDVKSVTSREESEGMEADTSGVQMSTSAESTSTASTPGSRRVSLGTPVMNRRSGGVTKKPSLDAFAQGIIPFQVEEPTPRTGFLAKIMKKIKDTLG